MLLRLVVEAEGDPMGVKEDLAMALERYAPAKVVEVAPIYRQEQMNPGATVNGSCRHTPSGASRHLPLCPPFGCPGGRLHKVSAGADGSNGGRMISAPTDDVSGGRIEGGILEGIPTEGVVGPFARADAAFRAAVESNIEMRGE